MSVTFEAPFKFHAPVLKPNFYLSLGDPQLTGNLEATRPSKVVRKVKLLFQLRQLMCAETDSRRTVDENCVTKAKMKTYFFEANSLLPASLLDWTTLDGASKNFKNSPF